MTFHRGLVEKINTCQKQVNEKEEVYTIMPENSQGNNSCILLMLENLGILVIMSIIIQQLTIILENLAQKSFYLNYIRKAYL